MSDSKIDFAKLKELQASVPKYRTFIVFDGDPIETTANTKRCLELPKGESLTPPKDGFLVVEKSAYNKLLIALQEIANTRPHKEAALEMKNKAKKVLEEA